MKSVNVTEQLTAMQKVFQPTSAVADTLRENACCFWQNQEKVIDSMQTFANGWFERRHTGARAGLEAAERMCKAESPVEFLREYQDWLNGALGRVSADGLACQQHCMTVVGVLSQPLALPGGAKEAETVPSKGRAVARSEAA